MALNAKYDPRQVEDRLYREWMEHGFFHANRSKSREPYTIVIPPPNVTGVLHMGHMLNNTIQDVLIRKARMEGKEACWVPGTDHASIATEARVVAMLRERGIKKHTLTRETFLEYAWEWREKYGGIILEQLKKLGASCDWERTHFTMDPEYYKSVIRVFVDLYNKGCIYRGLRMINWDCEAKTALSNEEVVYNEEGEKAKLYSVRYKVKGGSDEWVTVATVRPETILGDTAIAVNPHDRRYKKLIGKTVLVPFIEREIPVIADDYVDKDFGTGCLKITPAHDPNDYEIGLRHKLPVIDTIDDDGSLNENCGVPKYTGMDRFEVREMITRDLEKAGHLVKTEEFVTRIGRSERTHSIVEPKLSLQWFIRMKEISATAAKAVEDDEVVLHPAKFKNTYRHWMENVRDWCISRQLWWGHRIPAWYYGEGTDDYVVAEDEKAALRMAREKTGKKDLSASDLVQDPDVLDTWASSWLWPIEVFNGFNEKYFDKQAGKIDVEKNKDLSFFYPTSVLVTAPDILFFWVARMIIAGYEYTGMKPFHDVYLTGMVRDKKRRKMSKSLGNSPEPLDLIENYGADGVRTGMLFSSPAGNDLLFDVKLCEQGRNFANKVWNAFRLIEGWSPDPDMPPDENAPTVEWFESKLNYSLGLLEEQFGKYRISDALMTVYRLVWEDFCSWYLELIKPPYQQPIDRTTYDKTVVFFEKLMKMLHPFMPFITEEIYRNMKTREDKDYITVSGWPEKGHYSRKLIGAAEEAFGIITNIRNLRNANNISPRQALDLKIKTGDPEKFRDFGNILKKLGNLDSVDFVNEKADGALHFVIKTDEFFIPAEVEVDPSKQIRDLEDQLNYARGFLKSVMNKLNNDKFVSNAPGKVVETEKKKKEDTEAKIKTLEESIALLRNK